MICWVSLPSPQTATLSWRVPARWRSTCSSTDNSSEFPAPVHSSFLSSSHCVFNCPFLFFASHKKVSLCNVQCYWYAGRPCLTNFRLILASIVQAIRTDFRDGWRLLTELFLWFEFEQGIKESKDVYVSFWMWVIRKFALLVSHWCCGLTLHFEYFSFCIYKIMPLKGPYSLHGTLLVLSCTKWNGDSNSIMLPLFTVMTWDVIIRGYLGSRYVHN